MITGNNFSVFDHNGYSIFSQYNIGDEVMQEKKLSDYGLKACENCSWYVDNDFCLQHCCYIPGAYYCLKWQRRV